MPSNNKNSKASKKYFGWSVCFGFVFLFCTLRNAILTPEMPCPFIMFCLNEWQRANEDQMSRLKGRLQSTCPAQGAFSSLLALSGGRKGEAIVIKNTHMLSTHPGTDPVPSTVPPWVHPQATFEAQPQHSLSFKNSSGIPWWLSVKNPPADAGDMGSIPDLGRSHMPWSN